ncbi:hypothetical protein ACR82Z_03780 [Mycoplasma sp. 6243]|uniref:hypothetical protein n=1 Tax=Mycoplasma sp. 6243 TaxID=3440865 RepID=UPI003EC030AC
MFVWAIINIFLALATIYISLYTYFVLRFFTINFKFIIKKTNILIKIKHTKTHYTFKYGALAFLKWQRITHLFFVFLSFFLIILITINALLVIKYNSSKLSVSAEALLYINITYIPHFLLCFICSILFIKLRINRTNIIYKLIDKFEFTFDDYFLPKKTPKLNKRNETFFDFYHLKGRMVVLNIYPLRIFIKSKLDVINIHYFMIWGYHFDEVNKGNYIWEGLYAQFWNYKKTSIIWQ